jgi:hypothetical protein
MRCLIFDSLTKLVSIITLNSFRVISDTVKCHRQTCDFLAYERIFQISIVQDKTEGKNII